MHCLLARTALTVDGHPGNVLRESRCEPGHTGDVAGLAADGVDATEDHVVDVTGVDTGALDQCLDDVRTEIDGVHAGQRAAPLADRCANGVDDVNLGHSVSS